MHQPKYKLRFGWRHTRGLPFFSSTCALMSLPILCLVASCGKADTSTSKPPPPSSESDSLASEVGVRVDTPKTSPSSNPEVAKALEPSPLSDLSSTLVQKDGLLPLGYFTLSFSGIERQCMGAYVGQGRFVTAGHCFLGLPSMAGDVSCPSNLRIRWLVQEGEAFPLSNDKTACTKAQVTYREDSDPMDVAIVTLENRGTWPSAPLKFVNGGVALGKKVAMVGPQGSGSSLYFRVYVGEAFEANGKLLNSNSAHKAGYSGTPVFLYSETGGPLGALSGAVGIHLGSSTGTSRLLRGEWIESLLN